MDHGFATRENREPARNSIAKCLASSVRPNIFLIASDEQKHRSQKLQYGRSGFFFQRRFANTTADLFVSDFDRTTNFKYERTGVRLQNVTKRYVFERFHFVRFIVLPRIRCSIEIDKKSFHWKRETKRSKYLPCFLRVKKVTYVSSRLTVNKFSSLLRTSLRSNRERRKRLEVYSRFGKNVEGRRYERLEEIETIEPVVATRLPVTFSARGMTVTRVVT